MRIPAAAGLAVGADGPVQTVLLVGEQSPVVWDEVYLDTAFFTMNGVISVAFCVAGVLFTEPFAEALAYSVNVIFAKLAINEIGPELLADTATDFGYGDPYDDFTLPVSGSDLGYPVEQWVEGNTAQISFGQDRVSSNVFQMGLVTAAVANGGNMMDPRIVKEVRSPDGIILDRPSPKVRSSALDAATAGTLNQMMQNVITTGELTEAEIPGVRVAGKTGTAEAPPNQPHSWFVSFAPADDPEIAVAVMVENGGVIDAEGDAATPAIPIARELMAAHLRAGGG